MLEFQGVFFAPMRGGRAAASRAGRKLEMDEPMAGAGALLSGEHRSGDMEKNLKKDAGVKPLSFPICRRADESAARAVEILRRISWRRPSFPTSCPSRRP